MTRDEIILAVQTRADDVLTDVAIAVVSSPLINGILDQQLINVFKVLPIRFLPYKSFTGTIVPVTEGLLYSIALPADYQRLVRYKTSVLKRPIMEPDLVTEGGRDHILMYHPYVAGGNTRVRGCINKIETLKLLYNASEAGTIEESTYVGTPTEASITALIIDPVAWYVASVALQILGELEASKNALLKTTEFINHN